MDESINRTVEFHPIDFNYLSVNYILFFFAQLVWSPCGRPEIWQSLKG
jgi:hypothetical protein